MIRLTQCLPVSGRVQDSIIFGLPYVHVSLQLTYARCVLKKDMPLPCAPSSRRPSFADLRRKPSPSRRPCLSQAYPVERMSLDARLHRKEDPNRDNPVGKIAPCGDLHRAQHGQVHVPTTDHCERLVARKHGRARVQRDRLFAGVDQVRIHFALASWKRSLMNINKSRHPCHEIRVVSRPCQECHSHSGGGP